MATKNKIIEMIGSIKTIYSYFAKDTDVQLLVNTWHVLLQEYQDELVEMAFYKCLQICKMPPTPADVIEQIKSISEANAPTEFELWDMYNKTLNDVLRQCQRFEYTYVDESGLSQGQKARRKVEQIWEELPEELKAYMASKGEMMRMALFGERNDFEKQRFLKSMPIIQQRLADKRILIGLTEQLKLQG